MGKRKRASNRDVVSLRSRAKSTETAFEAVQRSTREYKAALNAVANTTFDALERSDLLEVHNGLISIMNATKP